MEDVQKAFAWQEAMDLALELVEVCEEFSNNDDVLVKHLRQAVVDVPATMATDLKYGRMATMEPVIRLSTELELVHRIYPSIDTGNVPENLNKLIERMSSDRFNERQPEIEVQSNEVMPAGGTAIAPQVDQVTGPRVISMSQHGDMTYGDSQDQHAPTSDT